MREIEFRAWLKDEKKMIKVRAVDFDEEGVFSVNYPEGKSYCGYDRDNIELMQYTNLKDKNGKKIFEDDIAKFTTGTYTSIGYVEFYNGMFQVVDIEDDECTEILCYCDELEVLGNCWDNPELLEVE